MSKNKVEHTTIRNEKLFCLNCGGNFPLNMPIVIDAMTNKISAFNDLHKNCLPIWKEPITDQSKEVEKRALWWISNGQVGLSSKTMWQHFMCQDVVRLNHPHDPDDFSRCYKLLQIVPEWKPRILELSVRSKAWKILAENWDKLTEMYEKNEKESWVNSDKIGMYKFMQTLI